MWPRDQCCIPAVKIAKSLITVKVPNLVHTISFSSICAKILNLRDSNLILLIVNHLNSNADKLK